MASTHDVPWKYIYIPCPKEPMYLKKIEKNESETESKNYPGLNESFSAQSESNNRVLFLPKVEYNDLGDVNMYLRTAIDAMVLYRQAVNWSKLTFSHSVCFSSESKTCHTARGVYVSSTHSEIHHDFLQHVRQSSDFDHLTAFKITRQHGNHFTLQTLSSDAETCGDAVHLQIVRRHDVEADYLQQQAIESPIFTGENFSPIFHDYTRSKTILEQLQHIPEVKQLLEIAAQHITQPPEHTCRQSLPHPFVVVEGMDATGKTTLTEHLESKMGAARYYTPPPQVSKLRPFFDKLPEIVRRAYYSIGNYIVAMEIVQECQTRPVIMDRYWHSTAAYGIANESSSGDMPQHGHPVYSWPCDLLKPTLVLFLTVTEDVRKQRLAHRGVQATFEEKFLDSDMLFRQRLCEAYRRMVNPTLIEIDAGGTQDEVQAIAMAALEKHNIHT